MKIKKNSILKTAKGYRLRNSTHNLIEKIQLMTNGSKDTVISRAVRLYYTGIKKTNKEPNIVINKSKQHKPFSKIKPK
jgi:hypothetical protein